MLEPARKLAEIQSRPAGADRQITLLELVAAVADFADNEAEVVATVESLINSGKVTLVGAFRGTDVRVERILG